MSYEQEFSESGQPIHRYDDPNQEFNPAFGDEVTIEEITDHFARHVGEVDSVFHEIISQHVHIDVHIIRPSEDRPYYTIFTTGMSDLPMSVSDEIEEAEELKYAELMLCLPSDWFGKDIENLKVMDDTPDYWPIHMLKFLARFPHLYDTWIGFGHTLPNGDPPESFAEDTKLCCALLLSPVVGSYHEDLRTCKLSDGRVVNIYSIVPIYEEELNLKLKKGTEALFDGFDKHRVNELLDPKRINTVAKRKRFGLF